MNKALRFAAGIYLSAALVWPGVGWAKACFIDSAVERNGALDLYIRSVGPSHVVRAANKTAEFAFVAERGLIIIRSGVRQGEIVDHISVRPGDRVILETAVESRCNLTVVGGPGTLGYDWISVFDPPGGPFLERSGHEGSGK